MSSSSSDKSSGRSPPPSRPLDPISRTALRYTLSPREYELLHQYLISRAPQRVQQQTPSPRRFEKITGQKESKSKSTDSTAKTLGDEGLDNNVVALRSALRVFVGVYVGFKGYETIMRKLAERRGTARPASKAGAKFGTLRLALSFSSILLFHKLLHRFFRRLRSALLEDTSTPFRKRNPRVAAFLTSTSTPATGAALSGFFLALSPPDQLRITIAIYVFTRSLEFSYNALEARNLLFRSNGGKRPWWFGSWLLMPFACGQLLHAFVFDRDCFPADYGRFIVQRSPEYIQTRPKDYPKEAPWPGTFTIVDALAQISRLNWPPFISPILFPSLETHLPPQLSQIAPVTAPAHPATLHTSCALLHPRDPSCLRTYLKYFIAAYPGMVRFFTIIYGAFSLLAYKSALKDPLGFLNRLSARILRMALFVTGAIGSAWGSICLFNALLPRNRLATQRWFLGGMLGGLWAFVARKKERGNYLYSVRLSIDSLWKVGKKHGWWKGVKNGDVLAFTASLMLLNYVYQVQPGAVQGGTIRKGLGVLRGEGWTDRAEDSKEAVEGKGKEKGEIEETEATVMGEKTKDE